MKQWEAEKLLCVIKDPLQVAVMCLKEIQKRALSVGGAKGQSHAQSHSHRSQSTGASFCRGADGGILG